MNRPQLIQYASLTLIFGGIAILGASVGTRFAIGIVASSGCSGTVGITMEPCQAAIKQLNTYTKTLLVGGAVSLLSGIFALNSLNQLSDETTAEAET